MRCGSNESNLMVRLLAASLASLFLCIGTASATSPAQPSAALAAFGNAWTPVTAYNATITVFEQKGTVVQSLVFKYTFRKPTTVTVDVVGGPNNGVSILWTGGPTVSAHRAGLISAFKKTLSLHDPQLTTIRGSSFDELSFAQILTHMLTTRGKISQSDGPSINNTATDAVTLIPADPATNAGYTREIIEISRQTHFPLRVLGYQGSTLVRNINVVNVQFTR
jgi:hypothetical protein